MQRQVNDIALRATSNQAALDELREVGEDVHNGHITLRGLLDSNVNTIRSVNSTLTAYSDLINALKADTERLHTGLQVQSTEQSRATVTIAALNITQAQQRSTISYLQKSVEDTSQAVQKLKNDYQGLQQTARQSKADTDWLREKVQNLQALAANNSALVRSNSEALDDMGSQLSTLSEQVQNASSITEGHDQSLRELMDRQRDHDNITSSKFDRLEARLDGHENDMDRVTGNVSFTTQLLRAISTELNGMRSCTEQVTRHSDLLLGLNSSLVEARADGAELRAQQDDLAARLDKEVGSLSMVMEEMKLVDTKHTQLITNFTILQGEVTTGACC